MIKNYTLAEGRKIIEQAHKYYEEVGSGLYMVRKNRFGEKNVMVDSQKLANEYNTVEKVSIQTLSGKVYANFEPVLSHKHLVSKRFATE